MQNILYSGNGYFYTIIALPEASASAEPCLARVCTRPANNDPIFLHAPVSARWVMPVTFTGVTH